MPFLIALAAVLAAVPAEAAPNQFALQSNLDHVWTMTAAGLVFMMQAGFLLLEAGQVRSKNSVNVAQKNLVDFILSTVAFGLVGFALMFGPSQGGLWGWDDAMTVFGATDNWSMTFFVFQLVFCGTAATIVSGAVAERMNMRGYILCTLLLALLIYPVSGHWAWGGLLTGDETPYLAAKGFMDFAGATVVHSVGAWVGLAAIVVIGPRFGKYDENGKARQLHGHSPILATAGCVILWVGWIGFNGGSTTAGTEAFSNIVMNTMVAAAGGGAAAMMVGRLVSGLFKPMDSINGVLGGLVGITAGCDAVTSQNAFIIGASAAIVAFLAAKLLEHVLKFDDPLHAVAVHGFGGVWGTLMVGVFARPEALLAGSRSEQILVQLEGIGIVFAWAFGVSFVVFKLADMIMVSPDGGSGLRVSEEHEREGLNIAEHGAPLGNGVLQGAMARMASEPDMAFSPVEVDHGDEAYEMSLLFNQIVENENNKRDQMAAKDAERQKAAMEKAVSDLLSSEIGTVIEENARGNYRSRVPLEGKSGVMLDLARTINTLSESTANSLESVRGALRGFLEGDLEARIEGRYEGMLADIQEDVNGTIGQLREAMQAMDGTVAAASAGDFSRRIDLDGKTGVLAGLCQGLNDINKVCEAGLGDLQQALGALADGDLTARMVLDHEGQFAEIRDVLHRTISELNVMVSAIAASAGKVAQAGSDVSGIADTMGNTARSQAALMETAAGVLSDLSDTSQQNTARATEARERCDSVRAKAEDGHGTAAQATEHMDLVRGAAQEIAQAILEIEAIAKQTKLLALNASVEAVRGGSGEDGRSGFKVVAQEVRELALRTQEAAAAVREKADHVSQEIVHGQELVQATSDGLSEIVEAAGVSADLVRDVARSGEEQNARIGEGDASVARASEAAAESLRQVETSQDTAQALTESAARTRALLDRFDLGEEGERRVA